MSHGFVCPLCESTKQMKLPYSYRHNGIELQIVRCAKCELARLHPMLSESEVRDLYTADYFNTDYHCGTSKGAYAEECATIRHEFRPLLALMKDFRPEGAFLEIGCAGGAALAEARQAGYEAIGVELSPEMAEWGREHLGLDIRAGTLDDHHFPDCSFDVVFMGDVIEHLPNPFAALVHIRRVLKPKGIIALAYPTELNHIAARLRMLLRLRKQSPHKPYHLYYYTCDTLRQILEHCGFEWKLERVGKIRRSSPLSLAVIDTVNFWVTKLTGKLGDRGFTIAMSNREESPAIPSGSPIPKGEPRSALP